MSNTFNILLYELFIKYFFDILTNNHISGIDP